MSTAQQWAYVIAYTREQAHQVVSAWVFGDPRQRRLLESMDVCFKGEADARVLVPKHGDNRPRVWRVSILVEPVEEGESA